MPPVRFQRSRALWDNCRSINYHHDDAEVAMDRNGQRDTINRYVRAILYEIQPVRYSIFISNFISSYRYFLRASSNVIVLSCKWIPILFNQAIISVRCLTRDQWKWTIAIALYYIFLRWIHATLDAGPVVVILTALTIIFTVGLSDQKDMSGLSAYSVFNKGFQKIMGSIEADDLLQQHLGGGGIMQMMQRRHMEDDFDVNDEQPRGRQRQNVHLGNNNNNPDGDHPELAENNNNRNRARRTGKKARRGRTAHEQRREIRAQREAALAMGFGQINDDDIVEGMLDRHDDAMLDDVD